MPTTLAASCPNKAAAYSPRNTQITLLTACKQLEKRLGGTILPELSQAVDQVVQVAYS